MVARGVRNTVGFDFHPKTKELWFTDNQRDWLSEDLPQDELNRLSKPGQQHFGYPYCHHGDFADPEFGWGKSCADYVKPALLLGAHSAPLGMRFYTGKDVEPFMTGLVENNTYLGRPVDVLILKDGSLLVSDDHAGAIYRISYGK